MEGETMSTTENNPPSFRLAFESQIATLSPEVQRVHRTTLNAITDLQSAIPELMKQLDTKVSKSTTSTPTTATGSNAPATKASVSAAISAAISGLTSTFRELLPGGVNLQAGVTAYQTVQTDYGALLVFNDASPVALTMAVTASLPGITLPWYCAVLNEGAGTVTITPVSGQINGGATVDVHTGELAFIFYDGTDFWAGVTAASGSGVTQITAGAGIDISPSGGTGNVTVSLDVPVSIAHGGTGTASTLTGLVRGSASAMTAAEISGDATTSGSNALTLATVNADVGSFTNADITVNAKGLITAASNGSSATANVQTVSLGTGSLAPQTNMSVTPSAVPGQTATSIISAYIVAPSTAEPFFVQVTAWWDTSLGSMEVEISNCSTTLTWTYTGASLLVAVWI